ncbi:tRNA (adenosine(37)-N6)-threonylcarbamoyltransferase complex dimerization subunit type 1 TsaB [Oryzomicrobium sp.]|uniref:tRNA (adenosine(37)-N6)-threonylcarbamoyltransferase complex dimerization subunit type 1 TsaB n=1 Tax=Oryzomicrobium sp. TaxID=1911578 RepID=UPI0025CC7E96|nr:tRNA (adenosine(37)-N6)-threonylcarbamoyltransferase complex dimerization subunit type 1 TsaB [Oryzomicrobium sp.]MCE1242660.1 tRNA (adenosine(37)-N6)-threonylcarbamoyltransferase complex dimerization subunit type 1 TsaB [Oryzomicrobium sp.]
MKLLALDTTTEAGSCALWLDGRVIARDCPAGRSHSETLLPLTRDLLAEAGVPFSGLDAIAYGAGPGAFTGLRVACAVAQGLAVPFDLPVVPVGSLLTLATACGAATGAQRVLALLDARMNEAYAGRYVRGADGAFHPEHPEGEDRVGPPQDIELPDPAEGWVSAGNAPAAYPALAERLAAAAIPHHPALPQAATVAALAAARLAATPRADWGQFDAALAAPVYVRDKVAFTVAERLAQGGKA